jgi:hypothetical protein
MRNAVCGATFHALAYDLNQSIGGMTRGDLSVIAHVAAGHFRENRNFIIHISRLGCPQKGQGRLEFP